MRTTIDFKFAIMQYIKTVFGEELIFIDIPLMGFGERKI